MKTTNRLLITLLAAGVLLAANAGVTTRVSGHAGASVTSRLTATSPVLDGVLGANEWTAAGVLPFAIAGVPGTLYVMHDDTFLYFAALISDPTSGLNSFQLIFDNDHEGVAEAGDDALVVNLGNNSGFDDYFEGSCCYLGDPLNDVVGTGASANGQTTFELRHPLCSADRAHDFCLSPGSTVGFNIVYQPGNGAFYAGFPSLAPFNTAAFADLTIGAPRDTTPPTLNVRLTPAVLWPPNHRMVEVTAALTAEDASGPVTLTLVSVTSSEADNGLGDGDSSDDIQGAQAGRLDTSFFLRAERSGTGGGRVYTATYRAQDPAGNTTTATGTVSVPLRRP